MGEVFFAVVCIAVPGVIVLVLLFAQYWQQLGAKRLARHRSTAPGLNDLLVHAAVVDDGVIVGKNGAFMASWIYKGQDNASATNVDREQVSLRINQALAPLGSGWAMHVDAIRRPAAKYPAAGLSDFPDPVSLAIDTERRRYFDALGTMYDGYFVVTLTWFPPMLAQRKFVESMFDDDELKPNKAKQTRNLLEQFKGEIANLENRLSTAVKLTRLKGEKVAQEDGSFATHDGFLSWLQFCITGVHQPVQLPSNPIYLDALLGGQDVYTGAIPKVGRKFVQVISIEGLPFESTPGMLSMLAELPGEYRWSSRFIFLEGYEATRHFEKFRSKWKQKIRGFFDQIFNTNSGRYDQYALEMVADAEGAISDINSGLVQAGYYTSVLVVMDESRVQLDEMIKAAEKAIMRLGFVARVESVNTMDAYLGSIPGHCVENIRRPLINTLNLADLLPTSSIWTGAEQAPCPLYPPGSPALMHCVTHGQTPFRLNMHVRDLGHTLMFGPTRAGKSTHLALIAAQLRRYKGMQIFAFDKGKSMYPITKACAGQHYNVASDGEALSFCPLQFLQTTSDRAWAMEWVDMILALNGVQTTPHQRKLIGSAIVSMADSRAQTFSELVTMLQDEDLREALGAYTIDGMMGHLLDAQSDGLELSTFTTFEIEDLLNLGPRYALPVLLYLFRRIERSLDGRPTALLLDEAWIMLGHDVFRAKIREWLKSFAKKNCFVLMATQSLSDAANSGILDVLVESTATKIFLPNVYARDEDASALYRRMGLNSRQIEILASAIPKRQYYAVSEAGRRLYELAIGPLAMAFVGATDPDSIDQIQALEGIHGPRWVDHWLAMRNLSLNQFLE